MNVVQSWKESLELLVPKNLKQFLLVTIKTVIDVYTSINGPFTSRGNWIAIAILVFLIMINNIIKMFHLFFVEMILLNGILHATFFICLLAMRPSVGIKDWEYFSYLIKKYWYFLVISILFGTSYVYVIPLFGHILFVTYILFLLFVFDSHGSFNDIVGALKNSLKMLWYNMPIFLVLFGVLSGINLILNFLVYFAIHYFGGLTIATLLYILLVPIEVAFISNLYIKFIHTQSLLYFKQPE